MRNLNMLDDYGFEIYEENAFPLAYLITFRTFGTWLHGDERTSISRSNSSKFKTIKLDSNIPLKESMRDEMNQTPVLLTVQHRKAVHDAIVDLCRQRRYVLNALNVRTNHVHSVIGVQAKPERVADSMKAFSTKRLRALGLIKPGDRVWSRGRSRRYLWKPGHVDAAIDYVLYCQGDMSFEDWNK